MTAPALNHDTAAPGTAGIETQTAHGGNEFDHPHDHECEFCSPPLITMPPPQGRPAADYAGAPQAEATDLAGR